MSSSEQGAKKQPSITSTIHHNIDDRRVRTPSKTRTSVGKTNLLPSKFDKGYCRPLPPLRSTVSAIQRNDSRVSFKPAKSSDCGSHSALPVKGQHALNCSVIVTKVQTAMDHEALCDESKHIAFVDSSKNMSKHSRLPAQLQRSRSASRLSSASSGSSSSRSSRLSHSTTSESSYTRQSRSITPHYVDGHERVEKSTHAVTNGQNSDEIYSASSKGRRAAAQSLRQRSSSVSSSTRVSFKEINPNQTFASLHLEKDNRVNHTEVSGVLEGRQQHNFTPEKSSTASNEDGKAKSQNNTKQSPSDDQSVEQLPTVCSSSLEHDGTVDHLHKQKPLEKNLSNHGILGGKSDEEISEPLKTSVSVEWKSSFSESQQNSVVRAGYLYTIFRPHSSSSSSSSSSS